MVAKSTLPPKKIDPTPEAEEPPPPLEPSHLPLNNPEGPVPEHEPFDVIEMPKDVPLPIPVDYDT